MVVELIENGLTQKALQILTFPFGATSPAFVVSQQSLYVGRLLDNGKWTGVIGKRYPEVRRPGSWWVRRTPELKCP
jgi:hypothetical protein